MPTEAQAGERLRELHRAWQDVKAGRRSVDSVCKEFALFRGECGRAYRLAGLENLPEAPPTWWNSFQFLGEQSELPRGRVLEVMCRVRGSGQVATNRVLIGNSKQGLKVHFTSYWYCYGETKPDEPNDSDYEPQIDFISDQPPEEDS